MSCLFQYLFRKRPIIVQIRCKKPELLPANMQGLSLLRRLSKFRKPDRRRQLWMTAIMKDCADELFSLTLKSPMNAPTINIFTAALNHSATAQPSIHNRFAKVYDVSLRCPYPSNTNWILFEIQTLFGLWLFHSRSNLSKKTCAFLQFSFSYAVKLRNSKSFFGFR